MNPYLQSGLPASRGRWPLNTSQDRFTYCKECSDPFHMRACDDFCWPLKRYFGYTFHRAILNGIRKAEAKLGNVLVRCSDVSDSPCGHVNAFDTTNATHRLYYTTILSAFRRRVLHIAISKNISAVVKEANVRCNAVEIDILNMLPFVKVSGTSSSESATDSYVLPPDTQTDEDDPQPALVGLYVAGRELELQEDKKLIRKIITIAL